MEIVSKQDYWTTILNDLTQFGQIYTEDVKFNEIANYVWRVLQNTLILTEDEKQIKHWEDIVNVSGEGLTQFQRKVNLLFLLSEKSYIPVSLLRKALNKLLGEGEYILNVDDENNKIYLGFSNYPIKGKVDFLLSKTIPSYYENEVEADKLPKDYLPVDFLETTGTQTLRVDTPIDNEFGLYFDVVATNETAANNFAISMQTSEGGYKNIRIGSGTNASLVWWTGGSVKVPGGVSVFNKRVLWQANFKNNRLLTTDSEFGYAESTMKDIGEVSDCLPIGKAAYVEGGKFKNWMNYPSYLKAYSVKLSRGSNIIHDLVPALDSSGTPCMYDKMTNQTIYNSGSDQFVVGTTMHQAINFDKLPNSGGTLTISLPWEAQLVQHNSELEAALETARSKGWLMKAQYREPEADSAVYNKYAACTTVAAVRAVNPDYMADVTNDGEWCYPLTNLTNAASLFQDCKNPSVKKVKVELPAVGYAIDGLVYRANIEEVDVVAPNARSVGEFSNGGRVKKIRLVAPLCTNFVNFAFGNTALTDFEGDIHSALGMSCGLARLNKTSILWLCGQMPIYTGTTHDAFRGTFEVGVHVDHKNDEEVLAAISSVEEKNYVVVLAWNGTPTVSTSATYGLRKPPIYAKLNECENKQVLSYGHYVTNWEENGYQEFASVEEAEEYFGIEKEAQQ